MFVHRELLRNLRNFCKSPNREHEIDAVMKGICSRTRQMTQEIQLSKIFCYGVFSCDWGNVQQTLLTAAFSLEPPLYATRALRSHSSVRWWCRGLLHIVGRKI
ncbi:unnamed protein product [Ixodes pacificus]